MSEFVESLALVIESFGVGWQFAAIVVGASTPILAIGFTVWLVGFALWAGVKYGA